MKLLHIGLAVLALSLPLSVRGEGRIFSFVDANGVLHLSNADEDRGAQATSTKAADARASLPEGTESETSSRRASGFRGVIEQAAIRHGIDAALLNAVIAVESAFDPGAVSPRGARGLMQLTPATAARYRVTDVFDPADNVRAGALYLNDLLKRYDNDLSLTLAAYNAGEGAVLKYGNRIPPFRETVAYVPKVMAAYERYRSAI